jgi:hypothetical protein
MKEIVMLMIAVTFPIALFGFAAYLIYRQSTGWFRYLLAVVLNDRRYRMTSCEKLGYKVGDYFVVRGNCECVDNSVARLEEDDGSPCPYFFLLTGSSVHGRALYIILKDVYPLTPEEHLEFMLTGSIE